MSIEQHSQILPHGGKHDRIPLVKAQRQSSNIDTLNDTITIDSNFSSGVQDMQYNMMRRKTVSRIKPSVKSIKVHMLKCKFSFSKI